MDPKLIDKFPSGDRSKEFKDELRRFIYSSGFLQETLKDCTLYTREYYKITSEMMRFARHTEKEFIEIIGDYICTKCDRYIHEMPNNKESICQECVEMISKNQMYHCTRCGKETGYIWLHANKGPNGFDAWCKKCADETYGTILSG